MKNSESEVKECLRPDEGTSLQLLIAKLRNTNRNSYWNKETDKTRYHVSNHRMDPNETTFGKPYQDDGGFAEIMKSMTTDINEDPEKGLKEFKMYAKNHGDFYQPEQISRSKRYECPVDKLHRFGKKSDCNWEGLRIKKLLQWINADPVTKVICLQADFYNRSQPQIGQVKNPRIENYPTNFTFGKQTNSDRLEVSEILKQAGSINSQFKKISRSLRILNKIRIILKKREISFREIEEELKKFDKKRKNLVDLKILFDVLKKFRIFLEEEAFCELLKIFKYLHEDKVNYTQAINLLNCNCEFPEIPKTEEVDLNNYLTTYNQTIGNIRREERSQNIAKNVSNEDDYLKFNQSIMTSAMTPNTFTNFGLAYEDLIKPRSKETIQSITKKLKDFPEEKFHSIWEEGFKMDQTGGVCILTFKNLLDKLITKITQNNQITDIVN